MASVIEPWAKQVIPLQRLERQSIELSTITGLTREVVSLLKLMRLPSGLYSD